MKLLAVPVVATILLSAAPAPRPKDDAELIQGTWRVVSLHDEGQEQLEKRKLTLTFEKGKIVGRVDGQVEGEAKDYKLDPSKSPKWIDVMDQQETYRGIYELDGDTLRICHSAANSEKRPTKFVSERDSPNKHLAVLKREKP